MSLYYEARTRVKSICRKRNRGFSSESGRSSRVVKRKLITNKNK